MAVYRVDPLTDPRWPQLLERHPDASVFHTPEWLEALRRTYGYEPMVYTTCGPEEDLTNGIPFCLVSSWLTGKRLVSLPFSDHCQPLYRSESDLIETIEWLKEYVTQNRLKYLELRPLHKLPDALTEGTSGAFGESESFLFFDLDLTPDLDTLFASFHRSSVRQRVNRAQREGLVYREGIDDAIIDDFFRLVLVTRRKHGLPPQPMSWFRNLRKCLGDNMMVRMCYKDGVPVASKLAVLFKDVYYAKYQAADYRYSKLGGTQLVSWEQIKYAKQIGALGYDMGRCDSNDENLAQSKRYWAARESCIAYLRYPSDRKSNSRANGAMPIAKWLFSHLPDRILAAVGEVLYKHVG